MGFPVSARFEGSVGPIDVTVTADPATGAAHIVHLATEAGLCCHFLFAEFEHLYGHVADLVESGAPPTPKPGAVDKDPAAPAIPAQRDGEAGDQAPATPVQPFLAPAESDGQ